MPVDGRFTVDTNILVYAVDRSAGPRHRMARALMRRAGPADCVLILQALAEFSRVVTRKELLAVNDVKEIVARLGFLYRVEAADHEDLVNALGEVHRSGISFWDALLWSAARAAGCRFLLTEDSEDFQDGRELGGVRFLNPFLDRNRAELDALLGS